MASGTTSESSFGSRMAAAVRRAASDESSRLLALTIIAGLMGGTVAFLFHVGSHGLMTLAFPGTPAGIFEAFRMAPWWVRLAVPCLGGLLAGLVKALVPVEARARGMPEILEAVTIGAGLLKLRRAVPTALSSLLTYASGGSVGREGAIVQVSAAFASWMGRRTHVGRARLRMLVGCGVAAGIASAYRTPVAGALFALEVIYRRFAFDELGPIVVSSVTATLTSYLLVGSSPIYAVGVHQLVSYYEFVPYLTVGLLAGLFAPILQRFIDVTGKGFGRIPVPMPLRLALGGLVLGGITVVLPEVAGNGYEVLRRVLGSQITAPLLLLSLLGAKLVATAITVGSGGSGGIFTPSLLMGAILGAIVGAVVEQRVPEHVAEPGAYALVGMGCLLAATTRAPIMAILMVFETTQQYALMPPLMLASVLAYAVSRLIQRDSIYTAELRRRGIAWETEREGDLLGKRRVGELLRTDVPLLPESLPLMRLLRIFRHSRELYLYVGDDSGRLKGVIDLHDLKDLLEHEESGAAAIIAADLVRPIVPLAEGDSLSDAERRMRGLEIGHVPVVDSFENGHYLGVLMRRDLMALAERMLVMGEQAGTATLAEAEPESTRGRLAYRVVPETLVGTAADTVPEEAIAGEVVCVRRTEGAGNVRLLSQSGLTLQRGDVLVVIPRPV